MPICGLDREVMVPAERTALVPQAKSGYVYDFVKSAAVCRWWFAARRVQSLFLVGPTGCGKTSLVSELCAEFNWPMYSVRCNASMRPEDLEGSMVLRADAGVSRTDYQLSPLLTAYRDGGLVLLDEGNRAHPSVHSWLNGIVEGNPVTVLATGEVIQQHPMFRLVMTGNAGFWGDANGSYVDSNAFCVSFAARFRTIAFDYPDDAVQLKIISAHIGDPVLVTKLAQPVLSLAKSVRAAQSGGTSTGQPVPLPFSVRTLESWVSAFVDDLSDLPIKDALMEVYGNSLSAEDRQAIEKAIDMAVGGGDLAKSFESHRREVAKEAARRERETKLLAEAASAAAATVAAPTLAAPVAPDDAVVPAGAPATKGVNVGVSLVPREVKNDLMSGSTTRAVSVLHCDSRGHDKVYVVIKSPMTSAFGKPLAVTFYGARGDSVLKISAKEFASTTLANSHVRKMLAERLTSSRPDGGYQELPDGPMRDSIIQKVESTLSILIP